MFRKWDKIVNDTDQAHRSINTFAGPRIPKTVFLAPCPIPRICLPSTDSDQPENLHSLIMSFIRGCTDI